MNRRLTRAVASAASLFGLLLAAILIKLTDQLRFEAIQMPSLVQRGANFWLSCQFELDGGQQLYSVKWYKNNEEFYRLLVAAPTAAAAAASSQGGPIADNQQQQPTAPAATTTPIESQPSQQYFSQSGVNVLMSSSNATHVRLLNASLESEGQYACEISTQNLSTIRYEREIRVYVLPHSRLSVIGLKARYSLGEQLELVCASDFSRPKPALGWFINGQLIQPSSSSWFALETENKVKANEPTLVRQTLSLKFKLNLELLSWASRQQSQQLHNNQANQSHFVGQAAVVDWRRQQQAAAAAAASSSSPVAPYQLQPLGLQCKYRLTEVSDVTFNELLAGQKSPADLLEGPSRKRQRATKAGRGHISRRRRQVTLIKLADATNRLSQSKCPASRAELQLALTSAGPDDKCRLGQLALQPDDPVLVEPAGSQTAPHTLNEFRAQPSPDDSEGDGGAEGDGAGDGEDEHSMDGELDPQRLEPTGDNELRLSRRQVIGDSGQAHAGRQLAIGDWIFVNCSTISSLWPPTWASSSSSSSSSSSAVRANSAQICANSDARRRSLISGKYQTTAEELPAGSNQPAGQQQQQQQQQQAATNQRHATWTLAAGQQQQQHQARRANQQQPAAAAAAAATASKLVVAQLAMPAAQLRLLADSASSRPGSVSAASPFGLFSVESARTPGAESAKSAPSELAAPPLLEWFINNQEAPKQDESSALRQQSPPPEGDSDAGAEAPPPIDYASYFANFDSKPIQQHLPLRLQLTKKHFMTPDSNLRLRCSSTQAQLLWAESVSLAILPTLLAAGGGGGGDQAGQAWQQRSTQLRNQHKQHLLLKPAHLDRSRSAVQAAPSQQQQPLPPPLNKASASTGLLVVAWWFAIGQSLLTALAIAAATAATT